jgi:hypothetical protein
LVEVATSMAERPSVSLPEMCGDRARLKAAYRFFADDGVRPESILRSQVQATIGRLADEPVVLAVQDTTVLQYTQHRAMLGLGDINASEQRGLFVHSTLALTPKRVPLGLLAQDVWARDPASIGQRATRKERPIAEKESLKWLTSAEAVKAVQAQCPTTHLISVGDREADVYDLFLVERPARVDLLIRAAWDRQVDAPQEQLWAAVAAAPVAATTTVTIARHSGQPARTAAVTIRVQSVTLCPPHHREAEHLAPVPVTAIWVVEPEPPAGCAPIEWLLLTTVPVTTAEQASEIVDWYACRWEIEVWHTILKSGCRIEARQLETATRLHRCLTVSSVVAWRILNLTRLARDHPDLPCSVVLEPEEWQALACRTLRTATPPSSPPTLRQAVHWIARLGGFLGRSADGEPGPATLWRGFHHLAELTAMYHLLSHPRHLPNCG